MKAFHKEKVVHLRAAFLAYAKANLVSHTTPTPTLHDAPVDPSIALRCVCFVISANKTASST
jgi:hypothetical protein